jgi:opacity protein-like surface antigen
MKKFLTLVVALAAVFTLTPSFAGEPLPTEPDLTFEDGLSDISIYAAGTWTSTAGTDAGGALIGAAYDFNFLTAAVEYSYVDYADGVHNVDLIGRKYLDFGGINPYALAGGGLVRAESDSYASAILGAGLELELTDTVAVFAEYRYKWIFNTDNTKGVVAGLTWRF